MNYIDFFQTTTKLKQIQRTGWTRSPLKHIESVADHSYGVSLLALTIPLPDSINRNTLLQMAVMHDAAESIVGDIVCERVEGKELQMTPQEKHRKEIAAAKELFAERPHLYELFLEYETQESAESQLLKELDKLEMVFQALTYEQELEDSSQLDEFWINAGKYIKTPEIKAIYDELKAKRL